MASEKLPTWFNIDEVREIGIEGVAKKYGINPKTVERNVNRAGYSIKNLKEKGICESSYFYGRGCSGQRLYYCELYKLVIGEDARLCSDCKVEKLR
jgi:hypothetical protein